MPLKQRLSGAKESKQPLFSFEFFPPRTQESAVHLKKTIEILKPLSPDFCSVTYGAGGSTRDLTLQLVSQIQNEVHLETMAHLTCIGASYDKIHQTLLTLKKNNIKNILALRGDLPKNNLPMGELRYAYQLIDLIYREFGQEFTIGGACYPEGHLENRDLETNVRHARQKIDAGASFLMTQLFFDTSVYFRFVDALLAARVDVPIFAGIMPVIDIAQMERMTQLCGASVPLHLKQQLSLLKNDPQASLQFGIAYAMHQCSQLISQGVFGIHFYTLNKSPSTRAILSALRALYPCQERAFYI